MKSEALGSLDIRKMRLVIVGQFRAEREVQLAPFGRAWRIGVSQAAGCADETTEQRRRSSERRFRPSKLLAAARVESGAAA
jgi:hypothetical protein